MRSGTTRLLTPFVAMEINWPGKRWSSKRKHYQLSLVT